MLESSGDDKQVRPTQVKPDNSEGHRGRSNNEELACEFPSGPLTILSNKQAGYICAVLFYVYDTIYSGCFSDEHHVHYHLFPLDFKNDKGYKGWAINWLSVKECESECRSFEKLNPKEKLKRLNEIEEIVRKFKIPSNEL